MFTYFAHKSRIHFSRATIPSFMPKSKPGRIAQSACHLTRKSGSWVRYPVWQHTFVSPSAFSRKAVVSYWPKYVHEVLVNHLGGLSLPRKSVVRLTDHPNMTLDVYCGRKTKCNVCPNWFPLNYDHILHTCCC